MKKIKYYVQNSELGAGTRGSSLGPQALEIASIIKSKSYFKRYKTEIIENHNEYLYDYQPLKFAKRLNYLEKVFQITSDRIQKAIEDNEMPIIFSGDHFNAAATISGIKSAKPNERIGVIWIDAHGDLHTPFTTPSGNVHGMPVALSLGLDNLESSINNPSEEVKKHWNSLKNSNDINPKINPNDVIFFGVRDVEQPEIDLMERKSLRNYRVEEMRYRGFDTCLQEAIERIDSCDKIYISFDVDSMDCDFVSKGTGTPVPKGFHPDEINRIMNAFLATDKVNCIEFVEINPLLDNKGNRMAEAALEVLENIMTRLEK